MAFPKIKDRLFFTVKEQHVFFFIAKTTQNEFIAKPSSLSSHGKHNSVALVRVCTHLNVCVSIKNTHLVYMLGTVRQRGMMFSVETKGGIEKECKL